MTIILSLPSTTAEFTFTAALLKMQEHSKQQVAGDSPAKAQQIAAEKLSEAMMVSALIPLGDSSLAPSRTNADPSTS